MLDRLTLLFRFQTIAETGSLRQAARHLGVTQPALSRSLSQLEKYFGQSLLERQARGVVPTGFGQDVLSVASRLSRDWELAENQLLERGGGTKGVIRIVAGPLWRAVVLPEILATLLSTFPGLSMEVHNNLVGRTVTDIAEGRIDVGFGGLYVPDSAALGIETRAFTRVRDCVVAREDHPIFDMANRNGRVPVEALLRFPWLVYTADPAYLDETIHAVTERTGQTPQVRLYSESLISALKILQCSDCLCMLPDAAVVETSNPAIVPVPVNLGRRTSDSGAFYRASMRDWPPLAALLDLCAAHFRSDPTG